MFINERAARLIEPPVAIWSAEGFGLHSKNRSMTERFLWNRPAIYGASAPQFFTASDRHGSVTFMSVLRSEEKFHAHLNQPRPPRGGHPAEIHCVAGIRIGLPELRMIKCV